MIASTLRIRFDRRTGKEISRKIIDTFEISEDEYYEKLVRALTGMSPEQAAKHIVNKIASGQLDINNCLSCMDDICGDCGVVYG